MGGEEKRWVWCVGVDGGLVVVLVDCGLTTTGNKMNEGEDGYKVKRK